MGGVSEVGRLTSPPSHWYGRPHHLPDLPRRLVDDDAVARCVSHLPPFS